MNTPLLTFIVVIALIVSAGLTVKKACKTGHHAWCAQTIMWHHTKARAPVRFEGAVRKPCKGEVRRAAGDFRPRANDNHRSLHK